MDLHELRTQLRDPDHDATDRDRLLKQAARKILDTAAGRPWQGSARDAVATLHAWGFTAAEAIEYGHEAANAGAVS